MEEASKKRISIVLTVAAGIIYFFVCAQPLPKELALVPHWSVLLSSASSSPAKEKEAKASEHDAIPFTLGDRFGYFSSDGTLLFTAVPAYGVALSAEEYALYDRLSTGFTILSPRSTLRAKVEAPGYPFFAASRRFVIGPDQASVSELSSDGKIAWTRRFSSIVTTFAACPSLAVFGLMDGSIVGIDSSGTELLNFSPGASRIPGIYGVAVSPDGRTVAAVSGLDRQRLVVLEKRVSAYRVAYHRWLDSEYRRPIAMVFTPDGRRMLFESPEGLVILDTSGKIGGHETLIRVDSPLEFGKTVHDGEFLVFIAGSENKRRLMCVLPSGRIVVNVPLSANQLYLETAGDAVFVGADDRIARLDLREL
jgi:hypothetical protein